MFAHPLIEQLKQLKLEAMASSLSEQLQDSTMQALAFEERFGLLLDRQMTANQNRQLQIRLRQANLRFPQACVADINYDSRRQLDKAVIAKLSTADWLRTHQNLIITGACGTGKSWLGCALANKACLLGFKAQYWRMPRLLEELALSRVDGRYLKFLKGISKMNLLIIDDWAMVKLTGMHQQDVLEILDDRYQRQSTLVTSQLPAGNWHDQISDPTFADAILDRLLGEAYRLELKGPSLRRKLPLKDDQEGERKPEEPIESVLGDDR
jgi:DNA replication protein DnaC